MENRLEFILVWLGLAKICVVTALLNTNLAPAGLVHCAKIADTKWMIVGEELAGTLKHVKEDLPDVVCYIYGNGWLCCGLLVKSIGCFTHAAVASSVVSVQFLSCLFCGRKLDSRSSDCISTTSNVARCGTKADEDPTATGVNSQERQDFDVRHGVTDLH